MSKIDILLKRYKADQAQLMKNLLKERQHELINKQRLQRLFPPGELQKNTEGTMPPLRPPMEGLLNDINQFNEQHTEFVKELGTKHT